MQYEINPGLLPKLFLLAAASGHVDKLRHFVERHKVSVNAVNVCGESALMLAATCKQVDAVSYLLSITGVNLSLVSECEYTVLHCAAASGHSDIWTLVANRLSSKEKEKMLNQASHDGSTPLLVAVKHGNRRIAADIVAAGAKLTVSDARGLTLLHLVALRDKMKRDMAEEYVEMVRDGRLEKLLNKKSERGETPLHISARRKDEAMVDTWISLGGTLDCKECKKGKCLDKDLVGTIEAKELAHKRSLKEAKKEAKKDKKDKDKEKDK